jgi:TolA-binding protein
MNVGPYDPDSGDQDEIPEAVRTELDALAARHGDDPPLAVLRAASVDALPDPLQTATATALKQRAWYRTLVAGADAAAPELSTTEVEHLLSRVRQQAMADPVRLPRPRRGGRRWRPVAGLAMAAAILVAVAVRLRAPGSPGASPAVPAAPQAAAVAQPGSFRLPLEAPPVKLTAMALVVRSDGRRGTFTEDAAPAFDAYRAGDYRTAAQQFVRLQTLYPQSVEVALYLGVSRLFLDDPQGAIAVLGAARRVADDAFRADIAWYLAVADERAGDVRSARIELDGLCRGGSAYASRACEAAARFGPE